VHAHDDATLEAAKKAVLDAYTLTEKAPDIADPVAERIIG
jgi:hypothetical protein